MAHSPASEIPSTTRHAVCIRPEISMAELPVDMLRFGNESRGYENGPLLYSDATYNIRDFISREDNESPAKSYGDGSPNEICVFKLDRGKIDDELANDYRAETCVPSFSRESAIQKESCEEAVKSDGAPSRNEDESRCKSNRKRKTRRKMPDGVIIDLRGDALRGGMKISVISMHNLVPEMKFVAVPKKRYLTMRNLKRPRNGAMKKVIDNSILALRLCAENCSEWKNTRRSTKRKCKNYSRESTTINARVENNVPLLRTPNEVLGSTQCCHHRDNTPVDDIDNARYPILNTEQTCVDARKRIANYCCSIFNDKHQEYHIYDREDYNADDSDFNAEMQADWTPVCFYPEHTRAKGCRCFCEFECEPDINMQCDRCLPTSRAAREPLENSALPRRHQREEVVRLGSGGLRTDIALEFATKADEYSPDGIERCANCDGKIETWTSGTSRKRVASRASVHADLCDSPRPASRCEIDTRPGKLGSWTTAVERDGGDRSHKSDSLKGADTRVDARARRDNCIGRAAADSPSRPDRRRPGEKGGSAREVDSEWKPGSIETDAQQLDYKWKGRIATVDADGTRARVDFKGKRDSRYKSEEAIRVQLHESAEIRKRESLETAEATSQTRSDDANNNADGEHEMRDHSLWTSLQMGKIWSQMHDACKNVLKLAATSVGRVVRDAPKSERSQKNSIEVADATLVESSTSCAGKICGETCRKNLMRSKSEKKTETHQERTIGDVGKYRRDAEALMRKSSWIIASSSPRRDTREHAYRNVEKEKDEESCVIYSEYERDRYRNIVELPSRNETCSHDEVVHSQPRLSESFTYLVNSAYPGYRSRGGSDDNQDFAGSAADKRKPMQHSHEKATSTRHHQSYVIKLSKKCVCSDRSPETCVHCTDRSSQHKACPELSVTTDVLAVSQNNPLHHESQLTSISSPEDNGQVRAPATPEQTRCREEMETCESIEDTTYGAETERSFTSAIANAAVSLTETNLAIQSSQNNPDNPTASTSKWEASPVSPKKSRRNPGFKSPFCATAMKFWRRRSSVKNKTAGLVLKRSRRSIGRKAPSSTAAATYDSGVKITQIEPSTVQTVEEGNKRQACVNVQVQTPDAIVTRILSEFLLSGEKKRRVLMSVLLVSKSDHDNKEAETQTSSNDVTSRGISTFSCPNKRPQGAITTTSKTVQCFVCDKPDCYEIKHSDNSITLEEALIAEYPETSELNDYLAERKADIAIPP